MEIKENGYKEALFILSILKNFFKWWQISKIPSYWWLL